MAKPKMTPEEKQEYLKSISFKNLVKEIDAKWSHTYIDVSHLEEADGEAAKEDQ